MPNNKQVTISISGLQGTGKSLLKSYIERSLRSQGIKPAFYGNSVGVEYMVFILTEEQKHQLLNPK